MELIAITENGELAKPMSSMPAIAAEVISVTTQLYGAVGYGPPWIGYLAFEDDTCVGADSPGAGFFGEMSGRAAQAHQRWASREVVRRNGK